MDKVANQSKATTEKTTPISTEKAVNMTTVKQQPFKKKPSAFMKLAHLSAMAAAWFVLLYLSCIFYYFLTPALIRRWKIFGIVMVSMDLYLWLCTMCAMLMTSIMDPGIMPKATLHEELFNLRLTGIDRTYGTQYITIREKTTFVRFCRTCHMFRPPRCSHCSVCNRCIESFDHHCPWVYNCVGRRNYRHYVLLLLGVNVLLVDKIIFSIIFISSHTTTFNTIVHFVSYVYIVISAIALFIVGKLTYLHIKLVTRMATTRERNCYLYGKIGGSPFHQGLTKNWYLTLCSPQYPSYTFHLPKHIDIERLKQRYTKEDELKQDEELHQKPDEVGTENSSASAYTVTVSPNE